MPKYKKSSAKLAAAALLAACWTINPAPAFAESGSGQTEITLPEVVVTATRTEQTVKDTPSTVQVITREEIERQQSQTLADVLRNAVGIISFTDFQNRPNLSIRGSESRHVLIMVDGRRLSGELSYNSANAYDISRIRMDNVERIEIIRGSAGALYGSDAMGGVINIITKKPVKNEGHLQYEYAGWDGGEKAGQNMQLYYQGMNDDGNFSWSFSAGQHKPQPFTKIDQGVLNGPMGVPTPYSLPYTVNYYGKETPIALSGTWNLDKNRYVRVDYSKLWEDTYKRSVSVMSSAKAQLIKNDNTRTDWSVEYGGKTEEKNWQVRAYQSSYDKDYSSYDNGTLSKFDLVDRKISTLEGRNSWQADESNKITAGWEWRKDESEGTRIKKPGSTGKPVTYGSLTGFSDDASLEYRAMYIQDEFQSGDKLLVIPSVRYDWSDKFSSEITSRLGVTYKAQDDVRIKAVIGTGYKTPTVNELYHNWPMFEGGGPTPGQYFQGNPDIKPENSKDYELSLEKDWDKSAARVSLFRSDVKNLIDTYFTGRFMRRSDGTIMPDGFTLPFMQGAQYYQLMNYHNVAKATIQGVETELSRQLTDAVKVRAGYVYLDARDEETNQRLTERARHQMTVGVSYMPPQSSWNLDLNVVTLKNYLTHESKSANSPLMSQSFSIVNIMAQNQLDQDTLLYVGVDNLTDHTDYVHGNAGRVYRTGVQYKF